jgi:hypothetical protein
MKTKPVLFLMSVFALSASASSLSLTAFAEEPGALPVGDAVATPVRHETVVATSTWVGGTFTALELKGVERAAEIRAMNKCYAQGAAECVILSASLLAANGVCGTECKPEDAGKRHAKAQAVVRASMPLMANDGY